VLFEGNFARPDLIDNSKLPVSALNVLPEWALRPVGLAPTIDPAWLRPLYWPEEAAYVAEHATLYAGRLMTLAFYVVLCWLVFRAGMSLYGPRGAVAATALVAFLPTLLGHAALVTVDAAATCTLFAAGWTLARCCERPQWRTAAAAGLAVGAAMLVKYTVFDLIPVTGALVAVRLLTAGPAESRGALLARVGLALAGALVVAVLVVNLGFGFQGTGGSLRDLACRSSGMQHLRSLLGGTPIPLPAEYLNGLDLVTWQDQSNAGGGHVYLLGHLQETGFPSYYLVTMLVKTPLPFLLLCLARPWRRTRRYWDLALLIPPVVLFVHLSFFFNTQIGLRYLLPAFPFLGLLAAANWDDERGPTARRVASGLLAVYVLGSILAVPRYLAYFNVLIGDRSNAWRVLADSNVDWGQDSFALWAWERAHAGESYVVQPYFPARGRVIVSVNDYLGVFDPNAYRWLRQGHTPVATIGDAWLLFDIDGEGR
jgi:4-amino-4-deoxy-L-arabinose transferase-like glycosyltransferase